jgi:hypothetical protein
MAVPEAWLNVAIRAATTASVHPIMAPQNAAFPLVVYRRTGTRRDRGLGGNFGAPVATFSVSIVAATYSEAKDIAEGVRIKLDNFTGEAAGAKIVTTALVAEQDNMERPPEGQSKPLYRVDQVYDVRFREDI